MKNQPLRRRLAFWTVSLLTIELAIFGLASGSVIYQGQLEAFREIRGQPDSPLVVRREAAELSAALINSYLAALPVAVLVAGFGVWWMTRKALRPLQEVADAAERIHARALDQRLPQPPVNDEIGRLVRVLNHTFDRLDSSFSQAQRFSGNASHELKTPLTIMHCEIESALRDDMDSPKVQNLLESLLQQTQRLSDIADNLLLLSRVDADALTLKMETLDFSALCRELAEDAAILALKKRITIHSQIPSELQVTADKFYLRRVLINLLDNAIKYDIEGGTVVISASRSGSYIFFRIKNTGPEIPIQHTNRIFQRFYRGSLSRSLESQGSGLGLSICREIVLLHGGQIWLERPWPGWTAFVFALPDPQSKHGTPVKSGGSQNLFAAFWENNDRVGKTKCDQCVFEAGF
jgi:two-component system, OmpR family, heavy metal sensor histidine kinase CusS